MRVERIRNGLRRIETNLDRVSIVRLSQILDGEDVMLWSQLEFATSLNAIDKQLRVLGALNLDLALNEIGIVYIERKQTHALTLLQRWEYAT